MLFRQLLSCRASICHLSKRYLSLAYTLHETPRVPAERPPLIILHGLFGSKQNSRSISKYAIDADAPFSTLI